MRTMEVALGAERVTSRLLPKMMSHSLRTYWTVQCINTCTTTGTKDALESIAACLTQIVRSTSDSRSSNTKTFQQDPDDTGSVQFTLEVAEKHSSEKAAGVRRGIHGALKQ
ncbi:hypothetical protein P3T76_008308 [Phytophthora citrophthora]|uniref:Uncharacterized protein n=1 Tax=Phytophthora citrophthora TaxID=4793 RepID=A0AAD9GK58_9STRA|nr:hypothetical protein P3T76_008298 [Phytophthora citrophthora]KAK1939985.1 hypothetical protein P3T76_008308 [Phytophthora citrophthora]